MCRGNPLPTVQWFKNDVNIDNSPDYVTTYNNGEAILKFEEVYLDDQGTYTCKAANRIGHAATSAALTVEGKINSSVCWAIGVCCECKHEFYNNRDALTFPRLSLIV